MAKTKEEFSRVATWRANVVGEYELPSGNVAMLKRVSLVDLVEQGGIPQTLTGLVVEMAQKQQLRQLSLEELHDFADVVNLVVKACFIDPVVADEPTEHSLGVREISFVDRAEVFRWANEAAQRLRPFRGKSEGAVHTARRVGSVREPAEPATWDSG
jgi:hypothetical protein